MIWLLIFVVVFNLPKTTCSYIEVKLIYTFNKTIKELFLYIVDIQIKIYSNFQCQAKAKTVNLVFDSV